MGRWLHREVLGHSQDVHKVSVPMFDPGARGLMIYCSCGKMWAL